MNTTDARSVHSQPLQRDTFDMKTVGNAVSKTTDTVVHDSASSQKNSQEKS